MHSFFIYDWRFWAFVFKCCLCLCAGFEQSKPAPRWYFLMVLLRHCRLLHNAHELVTCLVRVIGNSFDRLSCMRGLYYQTLLLAVCYVSIAVSPDSSKKRRSTFTELWKSLPRKLSLKRKTSTAPIEANTLRVASGWHLP